MPNWGPAVKRLEKELEKQIKIKDRLQMYQRTIHNSVLDEVSVYMTYRQHSESLGFTIEELNKYTPDWVRAKYELLVGEDKL